MAPVLAYLAAGSFIFAAVVAYRLEVEVGSQSELSLFMDADDKASVQDDIQDCLDFPSVRVQCQVELHPGACFGSAAGGQVQCWSAAQPDGPPACGAGLDSRCRFNHSDVAEADEAIALCTDLGVCETECALISHNWGACYVAPGNIHEGLAAGERCHCAPLADEAVIAAMHTQDHCLTERVGSRDLAFDGVCRFPSSASALGLQSCLDVPSFPGKCPMNSHPGACYKTDGSGWMCWSEGMWRTDHECAEGVHGFEGACEYPSFGERLDVADVPECWAQETCANCDPLDFWGGCFEETRPGTPCMCAPRADDAMVESLLSGRCPTEEVPGTGRAFSGVCKLPARPAEGEEEELPECQNVSTFAGQCPIAEYQGACYAATPDAWRCWTAEEPMSVFECQVAPDDSGSRGAFQGSCEYKAYGQRLNEDDVQSCANISMCVTDCAPAQRTWGACFADLTTQMAGDADGNELMSEQKCFCAARSDEGLIDDMLLRDSCTTRLIAGAGGATYSGVCKLPELHPDDPLVECLDVPRHGGRGCSVASAPGACYGNESWLCWTPERPLLTHYECQAFGYTDACRFAEHGDMVEEELLEDCATLWDGGARCSMCDAHNHSLACYQEFGDANSTCFCAERGNESLRQALLDHDCKTREVIGEEFGTAFFGVCKLPLPPDPVYRCETVPTYVRSRGEVDCSMAGPEFNAACFSETRSVPWQCTTEADRTLHCTLAASGVADDDDEDEENDEDDEDDEDDDQEPPELFDGACLFNGAEGWDDALSHPRFSAEGWGNRHSQHSRRQEDRQRRSSAHRLAGAPFASLAAAWVLSSGFAAAP